MDEPYETRATTLTITSLLGQLLELQIAHLLLDESVEGVVALTEMTVAALPGCAVPLSTGCCANPPEEALARWLWPGTRPRPQIGFASH